MFTCSMCKKENSGTVAFRNNAGSFCAECKAVIHARSAEAARARSEAIGGCIWCGEEITQETMQNGKESEHVCKHCRHHRDWLLKTIRISDRPAKYVARIENRECKMREERKKSAQAKKHTPVDSIPSDTEARMKRLELMLNKLTQALGV